MRGRLLGIIERGHSRFRARVKSRFRVYGGRLPEKSFGREPAPVTSQFMTISKVARTRFVKNGNKYALGLEDGFPISGTKCI
jgi:hypothetical protein